MTSVAPMLALLIAFLAGSIPNGLWISRLKGVDLRRHGSGNIGATNVFRVIGKPLGILCLALDVLKGYLPAWLFSGASPAGAFWRAEALTEPTWTLIVGLAAIAGHIFSPFVNFRGGKGVATSLGVFLAVAPVPVLIVLAVGLALIAFTGYVSLASTVGVALLPVAIFALSAPGERPWPVIGLTIMVGLFVLWRHRSNIERLMRGEELKLFDGRDRAKSPDGEREASTGEKST